MGFKTFDTRNFFAFTHDAVYLLDAGARRILLQTVIEYRTRTTRYITLATAGYLDHVAPCSGAGVHVLVLINFACYILHPFGYRCNTL